MIVKFRKQKQFVSDSRGGSDNYNYKCHFTLIHDIRYYMLYITQGNSCFWACQWRCAVAVVAVGSFVQMRANAIKTT